MSNLTKKLIEVVEMELSCAINYFQRQKSLVKKCCSSKHVTGNPKKVERILLNHFTHCAGTDLVNAEKTFSHF